MTRSGLSLAEFSTALRPRSARWLLGVFGEVRGMASRCPGDERAHGFTTVCAVWFAGGPAPVL